MKKKFLIFSVCLLSMAITSCGSTNNPPDEDKPVIDEGSKNNYLVTFKDENGVILESKKWEEGTIPFYSYVKEDTVEWDYTFHGWSLSANGEVLSSLPSVSEDVTYYAIVTSVKQTYTISFESNGGSIVAPITQEYGSLIEEPESPKKEKYKFVGWSFDSEGKEQVSWPYKLVSNVKIYAQWNEKVDIKSYLQTLVQVVNHDPYSYIPNSLRNTYSRNFVNEGSCNYDFKDFVNVSDINYGGHGEQWHMVLDNINQSERFYNVLSLGEAAINGSIALFNNYLDSNTDDTATHTIDETAYTAKIDFHNNFLTYSIQYKTNLSIPFFGTITPRIDMTYDIKTLEKSVRIQLSENNAMKYCVTDNSYVFAIEYGLENISRKAYFQIVRDEETESVEGHIYEFIKYKDKDVIPSCADFYIGNDYTSVVGNKASGLVGFSGYINELYETEKGKLLGYEVRETLSFAGISGQYNTLWFNLNNISGITSVKAIENENNTGTYSNKNPHNIYLNNQSTIFEPTYNTKLGIKTSRKYDVELRKQYFYSYVDDVITEYECNIPMMFIQANNDKDTNFSDFPSDILAKSKIVASVNLATKHLEKIQNDYGTLIDIFIENKGNVNGETIQDYIGEATIIK